MALVASLLLASLVTVPAAPDVAAPQVAGAQGTTAEVAEDQGPAAPPAPPPALAPVELQVAPYGDIYVDGVLRARSATRATLGLAPGEHLVEVKNPWARRTVRRVRVSPEGARLLFRLEPRPAELVVRANVDATVRVDGKERGRTTTGELVVLSVPMATWRATGQRVIVVERPGFARELVTAHLEAGRRTVLDVELKPQHADRTWARSKRLPDRQLLEGF